MTNTNANNLEQQIAKLTQWDGESPKLWQAALEECAHTKQTTLNWSLRRVAGIAALIVVTISVIVVGFSTGTGNARFQARSMPQSSDADHGNIELSRDNSQPSRYESSFSVMEESRRGRNNEQGNIDNTISTVRHVVRKATIELTTDDVRVTFLKAALLISEAQGEFVAESSLTGDGDTARATMVLRVRSSRLNDVLNELRGLGVVTQETLKGDDVTGQVVDLAARLRNEQRIETELLGLLDDRPNAPLGDVLKVRRELQNVRLHIEQLTAQQQHLATLVSLATVLVSIRHDTIVDQMPVESSLGTYLAESIADSWQGGLRSLVDAISFLIEIVIGGIIWWSIALVTIITAWRMMKKQSAGTGSGTT